MSDWVTITVNSMDGGFTSQIETKIVDGIMAHVEANRKDLTRDHARSSILVSMRDELWKETKGQNDLTATVLWYACAAPGEAGLYALSHAKAGGNTIQLNIVEDGPNTYQFEVALIEGVVCADVPEDACVHHGDETMH